MAKDSRSLKNGIITGKPQIWNASLVDNENINMVTKEREWPVLLACIRKDDKTQKHIHMLQIVAQRYEGILKVYFSFDDLIPYFSRMYNFHGTPTFLLMKNGKVRDSLFGNIDDNYLSKAIQDTFFISDKNSEK